MLPQYPACMTYLAMGVHRELLITLVSERGEELALCFSPEDTRRIFSKIGETP